MKLKQIIEIFVSLGQKINDLSKEEIAEISLSARNENAWFNGENVERALAGITYMLDAEKLVKWTKDYTFQDSPPKSIGIIMAGNIPLVGFHDLLCVCLSGHIASVKMSKDDSFLTKMIIQWLNDLDSEGILSINIVERLNDVEALIATGSDNTARYFEYYFREKPKIIRKNRTSLAIISGNETEEELSELGKDIFWYFGLGCRNISKLLILKDYDLSKFFEAIEKYEPVIHHHKYRNNYDYHKSIFLVNGDKHLDNGFLLLKESEELVSPLSVLYFQRFISNEEMLKYQSKNKEKIQCIVGASHIPFGKAQSPEVWDYADNVDTLQFCLDQ